MSLKLLPCFCYNPSLIYVLFTLLPSINSGPVPVTETLYEQFIHDLTVKNCHIPSDIKLPFINCTNSIQCLSTAFKECNTPESIKPKEKTFLLCKEIFDNLNNILCQHDKMFEESNNDLALSTQVCEDFSHLKIIPKNEQYLGSRLVDGIVCNVVCSKNFQLLCQILLWSYEVQDLENVSNMKNLEQNKEHISTNILSSTDENQYYRPGNQETNPFTYKQQQEAVMANTLEKKENVPKLLQPTGFETSAESKLAVGNPVKSNFENLSNPIPQQNNTVGNDYISSEATKKDSINTIPVNEPSAQKIETPLHPHEELEAALKLKNEHLLNVKTFPKTSAELEMHDLPETVAGEENAKLKNNQENLKPDLDAEKEIKKTELPDNKLQIFPKTNIVDDNQEIQNKVEADNGQNSYVSPQPNIVGAKINQVPENSSQFSLNKSKINQNVLPQDVNKEVNNAIDSQISDTAGKGVVLNDIKSTIHQTDVKSATIAADKVSTSNVPVKNKNSSEEQNFLNDASKQTVKDVDISSNSLNPKTSNDDDKFNQESTSTETPLEKMDDSDIPQPPDQDQYNDVECNEGDVEGDYERSDYDVYQHTKGNEAESKVTSIADHPSQTKSEIPKTLDDFASRTSIVHGSEDIQMIPSFPEQEDSHFIFYFLSIVLILMVGYVIFHNKQKIIALIVEGRHERRRRSHGVGYKKLETK